MEKNKKLKIVDSTGKEIEYIVLIAFKWLKTNKNYVVYTDNTTDENGSLNVFASIYDPSNSSKLYPIESDKEWDEIEKKLSLLKKGTIAND